MIKSVRQLLQTVLSFSALATWVNANVLVVDASGSGNFIDIQPAVNAATDGDTILIKTGAYSTFDVIDKALTIVGDSGAVVQIQGGIQANSLAPGKTLVLENMNATGHSSIDPNTRYGLYLSDNHGHVRVESCSVVGAAIAPLGYDAIRIQSCTDVAVTRTLGTGGNGSVLPEPQNAWSGAGIVVSQSTVAIYDCTFHGGVGDSAAPSSPGLDGASGASVAASTVFASGSSFLGGNGGGAGWGKGFSETWGGDGGNGISLAGNSIARLLDDVTVGGSGGAAGQGDGSNAGSGGFDRHAASGSAFVDFAGSSKHMISPTPIRENKVVQLTFTGTQGDRVALLVSNDADQMFIPTWAGALLVKIDHPLWAIPVGTIPSGGMLQVPWAVGDLGGQSVKLLHSQPVFISAMQGHRKLGTVSSVVILSHLY
jgi:hypothetical protein